MTASTLLIESQNTNNSSMGTGFVIHQDSYGSYILTCAHVVEQVEKIVSINGLNAEVIAMGSSENIDLAVVYVKEIFRSPLKLQRQNCLKGEVEVLGFSAFSQKKVQGKQREATLLPSKITLKNRETHEDYYAWEIIANEHHEIESGNSGAPLVCKESGKVLAVISNNKGTKKAFAISIEHLADIWDEMPAFLFESDDEKQSPFMGLSAFSIEQSHLFFGRDKEVLEVIEKLKKHDLVAVVGDSGSGKSSLIKAGVIPHYLNGRLDPESESNYYFIDTRPARDPFAELSHSISQILKGYTLDFESTNQIKKAIKSKNFESILNALEYIFKDKNENLLIYVDQFEELFTLCPNEVQKEFIDFLSYLLNSQSTNLKIKIVLTIRRDYYNLISEYETFFVQTQEGKYTLRRIQNEQLKECIEKPLEKTFIEESQVDTFSKAVLKDMGDESSELTLLQIALTQTWQHKHEFENNLLRTYHQIGEVSGALSKLADNTWKILTPVDQKILQYIMMRIIKPNETGGITRRLADKEEFSKEAWKLAQRLASAMDVEGDIANEKTAQLGRLLKIKGNDGDVLELSHEALVKQWPMYQKWLKRVSRDGLKRIHDYVIEQTKIYFNNGRKRNILLKGYELERAEKLLSPEYREYLSEEEIRFIEKSVLFRRAGWGVIGLVASVIVGLAVILYYSNIQKEKVSNQLVTLLEPSINRAIIPLLKEPINPKDINFSNKIFTIVVDNFKIEQDKEVIVAKSWFGLGRILTYNKKENEAIKIYQDFISHFIDSNNPKVLEYVARAWYNKCTLLKDNRSEYQSLVNNFKDSKNSKIQGIVASSWINNAILSSNELEKKELLHKFLEYFKKSTIPKVKIQISNAYNELTWTSLLNENYKKSKEILDKWREHKVENFEWMYQLNLGNYYLLTGQIKKAENIYLNYKDKNMLKKEWDSNVTTDILEFQKRGIQSENFNRVIKKINSKEK